MADQGGWRRRLLKLVVVVPVALLGILAVYSLASLTDGSLADLSAPVVASVVGAVLAVALLGRWLFTRRAKRRLVSHETANFAPAASWPPAKVSPLPAVASKWGTAGTPSVSRGPRMIVPGSAPKIVPPAPVVVPAGPVTANVPIARAVERPTPPSPRAAESSRRAREPQRPREVVSAVRSPGESSALAEYLNGREELATLIASVEARMPSALEAMVAPAPAPVVVPVVAPQPEPELQVAPAPAASEPEPVAAEVAPAPEPLVEVVPERVPEVEPEVAPEPVAASLAAQDAQVLTEAVEKVTRASELIAQSCALFTEAIDADRAELRALADAVMTLAQAIVPAPSTPRLVGGNVFAGPTRVREHDVVIDDERSDTPVSAPASASVPSEKSGSGAPRPAAATPRPSNWSAAQTTATTPTSLQPKPRFPGNRSES